MEYSSQGGGKIRVSAGVPLASAGCAASPYFLHSCIHDSRVAMEQCHVSNILRPDCARAARV